MAAAGGLMVYFAIGDIPALEGLRSLIKGQLPSPTAATVTGGSKSPTLAAMASLLTKTSPGAAPAGSDGSAIVASARKYLGVPYKWGGADPSGFDCSGLVTWVLHHDLGITLPSNTHTITTQFLVWGGATDVPRAQCMGGDLCCTGGHIGIAIDAQNMIHAPDIGDVVKIGPIQAGMAIRRVKQAGYLAADSSTQKFGSAA